MSFWSELKCGWSVSFSLVLAAEHATHTSASIRNDDSAVLTHVCFHCDHVPTMMMLSRIRKSGSLKVESRN